MVLNDEQIGLANALVRLEQKKLTQGDKNLLKEYVGEDADKLFEILHKLIELYKEEKDPVKTIVSKYTNIGFDEVLKSEFFKDYLTYYLGSRDMSEHERLVALKKISSANEACPLNSLKCGIYLSLLRMLVLSPGVEKDDKFISEILTKVNNMSEEDRRNARIIY